MDKSALQECLASVAQVELEGLRLFSEQPQLLSGEFNMPREQLIRIISELTSYTKACNDKQEVVEKIGPTALLTVSINEFGI